MSRAGPLRRVALVAGLAVAATAYPQDAGRRHPEGPDARSTVRLQYECSSALDRRDVTLFANGTVRLRQGPPEARELYLAELGPREMASTLRRLEELRSSAERPRSSPYRSTEGEWVAECELRLELEDREPWVYRFSEHEIPPVVVSSLVHVADELADRTRVPDSVERLPADYEPRSGDVLRTAEGQRYEVLRRTADRRGLELEGLDAPVRIFVPLDGLSEAFVAVEKRAGGPADGG